jgi:hypothetical protein
MAKKRNIFAKAEAAQKRALSANQTSITKIFDRLGDEPIRKPRFLLVDNEESVVQDWKDTLNTQSVLSLHADFHLFLIVEPGQSPTVAGIACGSTDDLIALIRARTQQNVAFDGFFIDGNLGAGAKGRDGLELISYMRNEIEEIRYSPFGLVTVSVENSEFRQEAADSDVVRYMPKFSHNDAALLPRMILEFEEMRAQARQAAWVALNQAVARDLEVGRTAVQAGEKAKEFLERHMGIEALYFRDGGLGVLSAYVMKDRFDAGANLSIADAPEFYRRFTDPSEAERTENWLRIDNLNQAEVGQSWGPKMGKWRALLARVGDPVDHEGGVYAVYAPPNQGPFRALEGPSLHHLAVQLSNRRARERERDKLRARQRRLTDLWRNFFTKNSGGSQIRELRRQSAASSGAQAISSALAAL